MHRLFWLGIIALLGFWAGGTPAWLPQEAARIFQSLGMDVSVDILLGIYAPLIATAVIAVGVVAGFLREYTKLLVQSLCVFAAGFSAGIGWYSGNIVVGVLMIVTITLTIIGGVCMGAAFRAYWRYEHFGGPIPRD